jgi:predicted RND superfamily exporter protein
MSRRALRYLGRASSHHPYIALASVAILTAVAAWLAATRIRIAMNVADLLPSDSEVVKATRLADLDFGGSDFLLCVIELKDTAPESVRSHPTAFFESMKEELTYAFDDQRYFRRRTERLEPREIIGLHGNDAALVAMMTDSDFDRVESRIFPENLSDSITKVGAQYRHLASSAGDTDTSESIAALRADPFGLESALASRSVILAGPLKSNFQKGFYLSNDGAMALHLLWPVTPSTDLIRARQLMQFLNETREGLYARNPAWRTAVRIDFTGPHVENAEGAEDIRSNLFTTALVSFFTVLLLFVIAFRQPEALLFVAVPLAVGVIWTLGLTSLFVREITQITLSFAAILIGLGIDFSIHLYNRYLEDMRGGKSIDHALNNALIHTGPSIVAGAMTTGFAFFGLMLTRFQGFQQLGLFGGIGIIMSLIAVAVTLPPLMVLLAGKSGRAGSPLATFGLKKVSFTVQSYPRMTVAASLSLLVFLGLYARQAGFNSDFQNLRQPPDSYLKLLTRIRSHFELPSNQVLVIVEARELNAALQENDQIYRNLESLDNSLYKFAAIDSLRTIYPSPKTQKESLTRLNGWKVDRIVTELKSEMKKQGDLPADFFDPFIERLKSLQQQAAAALAGPGIQISRESLADRTFIDIVRGYLTIDSRHSNYRVLTRVYPPPDPVWSREVPEVFVEKLRTNVEGTPIVLGNARLSSELQWIVIKDLTKVVLIVLICVCLYLAWYFRSLPRAALATVPVVFGVLAMLGVMTMLGIKLNYLNIIAIPLSVGIVVDSAIHLLGRFYEGERHNMRLAIERTGRAIVVGSITTIFGFGSLSIASFQSIREIGILSMIGVTAGLFAALVFLPAVIRLLDPKYTFTGGPGDDIG